MSTEILSAQTGQKPDCVVLISIPPFPSRPNGFPDGTKSPPEIACRAHTAPRKTPRPPKKTAKTQLPSRRAQPQYMRHFEAAPKMSRQYGYRAPSEPVSRRLSRGVRRVPNLAADNDRPNRPVAQHSQKLRQNCARKHTAKPFALARRTLIPRGRRGRRARRNRPRRRQTRAKLLSKNANFIKPL